MREKSPASNQMVAVAASTVLILLLAGFLLYNQVLRLREVHQRSSFEHQIRSQAEQIEGRSFHGARAVLRALANSKVIQHCLRNPEAQEQATNEVEVARNVIDAGIVYVMDPTGKVVASSSYFDKYLKKRKSLLGKNYRFRPYFRLALKGDFAIYPALGVTTGVRGIYCSSPIRNDAGDLAGVVVVKLNLKDVDETLGASKHPLALLTPEGIIFASNRPEWLYRAGRPMRMEQLDVIHKSRQFADRRIEELPVDLRKDRVRIGDRVNIVGHHEFQNTQWQLVGLVTKNPNYPLSNEQRQLLARWVAAILVLVIIIGVLSLNIIKRRSVEEKLQMSERRFRAIFDQAFQLIGLLTPDGIVMEANETFLKLTGTKHEDFVGMAFWEVPWWSHSQSLRSEVRDAIQRAARGETVRFESTNPDAEGVEHYFDTSIKPIRDERGKIVMLIPECRDITERQHAELELSRHRDHLEELVREQTAELRQSEEKHWAVVEAMQAGYLILNNHGEVIDANNEFVRLTGRHRLREIVGKQLINWTAAYHIDHLTKGLQECRDLGNVDLLEIDFTSEQHKIPVEISAKQVDLYGESRIVCVCRDITERKRAEGELAEANRKLIESALLVGKAEVATGVLHNVGNVLNSVGVGVESLKKLLYESRIQGNLERLVDLLKKQDDMADFVTNTSQGKKLTEFLATLSQELGRERTDSTEALRKLTGHVNHISEIIQVQQAFGKQAGLSEVLRLDDLIRDALQITSESFRRHDVRIHWVPRNTSPSSFDRHKVIQILVNLLRNAKDSVCEAPAGDRSITIETQEGDSVVAVLVTDNGVGIARDKLDKIFSHGFTTKVNGHGFGLHSCANAAKEMGGRLSVDSGGIGKGATFTLTMPLKRPSMKQQTVQVEA